VTGILGGTFDPVHRGHLSAATQLLELAGLAEVWLMPNAQPPHRTSPPLAPAQERLQMVRLATANLSGLRASDLEVERGGLSYTIDTFRRLRLSEPDRPFRLLLGLDAALQIESWHKARALLAEASFVIFSRPEVTLAPGQLERLGFPAERTEVVTLETPAISGRMVRERLRRGEPVLDLVTPEVAEYISDRGLYRA
jgi:nicotinate-nucleotide adenylyltransferase